ncbi:hypothetical protein, partial [Staphylococcus aureus]
MSQIKRPFIVSGVILAEVLLVFALNIPRASAAPSKIAGTHVSGNITTDTIWDTAHSPYFLDDQVNVLDGVALDIMP